MRKVLLFIATLLVMTGYLSAQSRWIARGAEQGELYLSNMWYGNSVGGPFYDDLREAIFRVTDNGRKD